MDLKSGKNNQAERVGISEILIFSMLGAIVWTANFWHSASFGLYEDDWVRIPTVIGLSWKQIFNKVIFETGFQGRPFHDGLIYLFSYLGLKLGGLQYAYSIGCVLVTINAYLFYLLLKRVYSRQTFAITGALTFCLFPADTTRDYLTHSLGIQPSLAFLLIALHCYCMGYRKVSYLVALLCLVAYEPFFLVFLVAPLFGSKWDSKLLKELFNHALILAATIIIVVIIRKFIGENQISNFGLQSIALLIFNPIIGSATNLAMLLYRPLETLFKLDREQLWLFCLLSLFGFVMLLSYLKFELLPEAFSLSILAKAKRSPKIPDFVRLYAKPIITGFLALILAYPLAMTSYGFAISGRNTRVHIAAIIGTSILSACGCSAILASADRSGRKRLAAWGLAGFFALLIGFGLRVQQDYQLMWQHQRGFWTDVVRLCPDLKEGTVLFVEPTGLRDTRQPIPFQESRGVSDPRQIKGLEWELPYVLQNIYQFPVSWQLKPKLYRLQLNWQDKILAKDNLLHVSAAITWLNDDEVKREVDSSNVILLETKNGQLTRRIAPLTIANQQVVFKQRQLNSTQFKQKYLYNYLIQKSTEEPIDYLIK